MPRPKKKYAVPSETPTPVVVAPALPVSYLTVREAAQYLRTSPWEIRRLIGSGKLTRTVLGNRFIIHRDHLDHLMQAENSPAMPKAGAVARGAA